MTNLKLEMLRIRMIEERIALEYPEQKIRCPIHLSIGQEAQAVGVCAALRKEDLMVSTHRSHAHYLAKGGNLKAMIGELYGRNFGCSRGHGGSMHLIDESVGFMGSTSIVGGTIPIGVGLAFAARMRGEDTVVAICLGDAALEEGVFHEAANLASLHNLKVVFVVENNQYSCFTHITQRQPRRLLSAIALAHKLHPEAVEEQDPKKIKIAMARAIKYAPSFIELKTWRYVQHCGPDVDDNLNYRSEIAQNYWSDRDPLKDYFPDSQIVECIEAEIEEAFRYAKS